MSDDDDECDVPQTISAAEWRRIQESAARVLPVIDTPWTDQKAVRIRNNWRAASRKAASN